MTTEGRADRKIMHGLKLNATDMSNDRHYPETESDRKLKELGYDLLEEHRQAVQLARLSKAEPVLDIATGSGRMLLALVEAGHHVITGDISAEVVGEAEARLRHLTGDKAEFRVLDAMRLQLEDASCASVVTANAMHHMEQPARVLAEMLRVLKPDGRLLLVEFNDHGFEVIDRVHQAVRQRSHERGTIAAPAIDGFLRRHFAHLELHVLPLNHVWIARGLRAATAPKLQGN